MDETVTEKKVGVLGCGPAGLMAAHAAAQLGCDVRIFSKMRKSFMKGAQYLHAPIPGATKGEPFDISYRLEGSAEIYREKVYGSESDFLVSPQMLPESHKAWDIRETYDWLYDTYGAYIIEWDATEPGDFLEFMIADADLIISSIPAPLLCRSPLDHGFISATIWSTDRSFGTKADNTVVCDGTWDRGWYRSSKIAGYETTEWPGSVKPPVEEDHLWQVDKPITTNCDCHPEILRVGRYGSWKKGELSHHAFVLAQEHILKSYAE